jgi:transcriptional regulator with XRE-family HTH domain
MKQTVLEVSPLRAFRLQVLGKSVEQVADELGIHKATYSRLEIGGERLPKKDLLRKVTAYLDKHKAGLTLEQIVFPEEYTVKLRLAQA